jgi:uncharacterized protein RhaS with RHS repeats
MDYDPQTGRYVEPIRIGLNGGVNAYAYASGNPVSRVDPLGLDDSVCMFNRVSFDPSLPVDPQQLWNAPAATKCECSWSLKMETCTAVGRKHVQVHGTALVPLVLQRHGRVALLRNTSME